MISDDFKHGENLQIGEYVIIEPDVIVGKYVKIGHRVTLKPGTRIGDNSVIDDHCITTGACFIGNNVNIRTGAIISKSTIIEDWSFIGPGVITNHTKQVAHGRIGRIKDEQLLTYIGFASIIGSQASILAGIYIGPNVIVGGGAVVVKDLVERGVYVGSPAKKVSNLDKGYLIDEPENVGMMYLNREILGHLKNYIPNLNLSDKYL
jgi:UDP-2-acetamido-3-amino-2,3-dideoxy-glucuronate N-acetyltransferase